MTPEHGPEHGPQPYKTSLASYENFAASGQLAAFDQDYLNNIETRGFLDKFGRHIGNGLQMVSAFKLRYVDSGSPIANDQGKITNMTQSAFFDHYRKAESRLINRDLNLDGISQALETQYQRYARRLDEALDNQRLS
jgi:hypothetical protein